MKVLPATDELVQALCAMDRAMAELEAERDQFEQLIGRYPEAEPMEKVFEIVEVAISQQNAAMVKTLEVKASMRAAAKSAWLAEAALRRAAVWLAASRSD